MQTITTDSELEAVLAQAAPQWLLKHSAICPTSSAAQREVLAYLAEQQEPAAMIVVQDSRPLSHLAAQRLGYTHQSPQLFLLDQGRVLWQASHWGITRDAMQAARG